jgi:L-2-hydroxyglutarate oxidase
MSNTRSLHDFIVIGGGILGMSTALTLHRRHPGCSILVLDKESGPARHQTGRNSGVIHAGVYYKPGSLKARFCKEGNVATKEFCREHGIAFDECGKLIVATDAAELERMQALVARSGENGIAIDVLGADELRSREPMISGVGAILVPSTGIVSYTQITARMGELVEAGGGRVQFGQEVVAIEESADAVRVRTRAAEFAGRYVVACGGLQSDRIVRMLGLEPDFQIIPFRGEYYLLAERHNRIVRHLIYPVPDPTLPFLGVHLTRMINGTVTVGPNAVVAFAREGYRKTDINLGDSWRMLSYPGFRKAIRKHLRASVNELRNSVSKAGYLRLVQKYCPSLQKADLLPYPAGIRAQAVSRTGEVVDDFLFMSSERALVVCNAPSPAATSAIPIGRHIVEKLEELVRQ